MQGSGRMGEKMLGELGLEENCCTAFVGAGGKTTAVYTCVGESLQKGLLAAAVTTTKMWKPKKGFVEWKAGDSVDEIRKKIRGCGTLPLTIGTDFGNGKIGLVPEQILARLAEAGIRLFVEADGAKGKWIKRPGANEPVVPDFAETVVGILNQKAVGHPFSEVAHRPQICAGSLGKNQEDLVDMFDLVVLFCKRDGIFQNCQAKKVALVSGFAMGEGRCFFARYRKEFLLIGQQGVPAFVWERSDDRQSVFMPDEGII